MKINGNSKVLSRATNYNTVRIRGKRPCSRLQPKPGTNCSSGALVGSRFPSCCVFLSLSLFSCTDSIRMQKIQGQNFIPERWNSMSPSKIADPKRFGEKSGIWEYCVFATLQTSSNPFIGLATFSVNYSCFSNRLRPVDKILSAQESKSAPKCLPQHTASLLGSDTHQHLPQNEQGNIAFSVLLFSSIRRQNVIIANL